MILYEEILQEFQEQGVKYVLVGGIAFNLLGGSRTTLDMDIVVEMSDVNLAKVVTVLKTAGYHIKQPVDPLGIADKKIREDWIKNKHMKAFNFYKSELSYQEVDILIDSPVRYEEAIRDAIRIHIRDLDLPVISKKNFLKMKKKSGRGKDLQDIKELNLIRKSK